MSSLGWSYNLENVQVAFYKAFQGYFLDSVECFRCLCICCFPLPGILLLLPHVTPSCHSTLNVTSSERSPWLLSLSLTLPIILVFFLMIIEISSIFKSRENDRMNICSHSRHPPTHGHCLLFLFWLATRLFWGSCRAVISSGPIWVCFS